MEACVAAAVLLLVHLGTARPPAEGRVVHHAPLGRCCNGERRADESQTHKRSQKGGGSPTCLGLVLAVRPAPPLGADAPVLIRPLHAGPSVLAGVAGALACDCGQGAERSLQPAVGTAMLKTTLNDPDVRSLCLLVVRADQKQIWLLRLVQMFQRWSGLLFGSPRAEAAVC